MRAFKDIDAIKLFLEASGYTVMLKSKEEPSHHLIIGKYIEEPIGCTYGPPFDDVLFEEPGATFQKCDPENCPICNE